MMSTVIMLMIWANLVALPSPPARLELLPRFKAIHKQKLYRVENAQPDNYPNCNSSWKRPLIGN